MWPRSRRTVAAGFSLIEMMVVLMCLGLIFWISGQLLFPMRASAERQRLQVESRQTARAAADYMAFALRGASDGNSHAVAPRNPLALMAWRLGAPGVGWTTNPPCPSDPDPGCVQLSYNNVAAADQLADPDTDIITLGQLEESILLRSTIFSGFDTATPSAFWFSQGCELADPDVKNSEFFKAVTDENAGTSKLLVAYDEQERWGFYQITNYQDGTNSTTCSAPDAVNCRIGGVVSACFQVVSNPGANAVNAPGGERSLCGACERYLSTGVRFMSYRVCNSWLQQKNGMFDPGVDNNCVPGGNGISAGWTSLLPNVEDLQIAYIFQNGQVMNSAANQLAGQAVAGGCDTASGVPCQGRHANGDAAFDSSRVIGFRVTVVGRSAIPLAGAPAVRGRRSAEDHIIPAGEGPDRFRRQLISVNALIRNRVSMDF